RPGLRAACRCRTSLLQPVVGSDRALLGPHGNIVRQRRSGSPGGLVPDTSPEEDPLRVLIADDHPIFLAGMQMVLASYPRLTCIATVTAGTEAVQVALAERPDVVVLDINMPDLSGVAVARPSRRV